ncbi:MAG: aldehyde ferredoxin oxidoreductase C-terminal domain-containing protein, partial [Dehalococcoidia bacterium]|nr:aldehyde ferredoxin oxidoreductase C-terminal domain-containing protein [Dehalococcoidia bacterium]
GIFGFTGKILRVDLGPESITEETPAKSVLREYLGGTGLGSQYLYGEVSPGVGWDDPENRLILAGGPLTGTRMAGAGAYSVVTKGPLPEGGASTQAMGYFGAYLKLCGYDAVVFQGQAKRWVYLNVFPGGAELRDATHLRGKDTWENEASIKAELGKGKRDLSVVGIGPAGENQVKFAAIVGDEGHVAAHNGVGAVMGSKRLKAVAAARGRTSVPIKDKQRFSTLTKKLIEEVKAHPSYGMIYKWGNSFLYPRYAVSGILPVKNMTTNIFPGAEKFSREDYGGRCEMKWNPCWACPMRHCHLMKITEGPYAGYEGEEPEYECWAAFSSLIGQSDVGAAFMLNDVTDRLGMDGNETGWLLAFTMECYERGVLSKKDTDGLELNWGNVEAARTLLHKVARREGIGNVLADGVKRAAESIGGQALEIGVYMKKGHAPRGHDHRARWTEILDYATSGTGTIETGPLAVSDPFSPEAVAAVVAGGKSRLFVDSLVTCMFPTMTMTDNKVGHLVEILNAATGWDFTESEAERVGLRIANLLRVFNLRHGIGIEVEQPSLRYGSAPVDGPIQGKSIVPSWEALLDEYYRLMGWDRKTGYPLPETLRGLGLTVALGDIQAGK